MSPAHKTVVLAQLMSTLRALELQALLTVWLSKAPLNQNSLRRRVLELVDECARP